MEERERRGGKGWTLRIGTGMDGAEKREVGTGPPIG